MKSFIVYLFELLRIILPTEHRYVRLTPRFEIFKKIYFFDKQSRKIFFVFARDNTDSGTADQIYYHHEYDLKQLTRYDDLFEKYRVIIDNDNVPLIIDCGGNIGLSSRYFSEEFPQSIVVCVEPEKTNMNQAKLNTKNLSNVIYCEAAIGAEKGIACISNPSADYDAFQVELTSEKIGLKVESIESVTNFANDASKKKVIPFIVKVDIEGFEKELFSRNTGWMDNLPLLIIELHDWMLPKSSNSNNFLKAVSEKSRDFVYINENIFSINNS
jgi:FkbM family methyltransferase